MRNSNQENKSRDPSPNDKISSVLEDSDIILDNRIKPLIAAIQSKQVELSKHECWGVISKILDKFNCTFDDKDLSKIFFQMLYKSAKFIQEDSIALMDLAEIEESWKSEMWDVFARLEAKGREVFDQFFGKYRVDSQESNTHGEQEEFKEKPDSQITKYAELINGMLKEFGSSYKESNKHIQSNEFTEIEEEKLVILLRSLFLFSPK